jgi:hypothetical protein
MAWREGDVIRLWRWRVATAIDGCIWRWQWTTAVAVAAVSKDASAITVTTPVRRGGWRRRKDSKDASNRGNATGNNQPAQQKKDERADKRSRSVDATRGDRQSRDCSLWRAAYPLKESGGHQRNNQPTNGGAADIDCWREQSTISQTPTPWWCHLLIQRHVNGKSAHPNPGTLCGRSTAIY